MAKVTLADVAKHAGVSVSTASVVFSGAAPSAPETKRRVLDAAAALGYRGPDPLAASLRRGRSGIVGVVFGGPLRSAFLDPVTTATLDGLADELAPSGAGLLLLRDQDQVASPALTSVPLDALAVIGSVPGQEQAIADLLDRGVPIVAIEGDGIAGAVRIDIDSYESQRALAQHVRAGGHTNVAIVTLPSRPGVPETTVFANPAEMHADIAVTRERLAGAAEVFPDARVVMAHHSAIDMGVAAGKAVLAMHPRPTAVLAQSDLLAAGVLRAALDTGLRVPEDLSITGFDGVRVDGIAPFTLTTAVQPAAEKGRAAARALLTMLDGRTATSVRFACEFREGTTSAPLPAYG